MDRGMDRPYDRGGERGMRRGYDRGGERGMGRGYERGMNRGMRGEHGYGDRGARNFEDMPHHSRGGH